MILILPISSLDEKKIANDLLYKSGVSVDDYLKKVCDVSRIVLDSVIRNIKIVSYKVICLKRTVDMVSLIRISH